MGVHLGRAVATLPSRSSATAARGCLQRLLPLAKLRFVKYASIFRQQILL
jgi:hypothetical protein